ncbi:unnamed protein product [Prorocentrum cordatum]|uniref:C3H1-type domain-containing protein n=1 Tax=Prorocentrum cordatum TaxID=2364126 RepID=A0ABN9XUX4_9DINO|nr:unnamed protein product [Polarella glacialis]
MSADALAGLSMLGRLMGNNSQQPARLGGPPTGMRTGKCWEEQRFGVCQKSSCRFIHKNSVSSSGQAGQAVLTGPSQAKPDATDARVHDFLGLSSRTDPATKQNMAELKIVVQREVIEKLCSTENGSLQYRCLPVAGGVHESVESLLKLLDPQSLRGGTPVGPEVVKNKVADIVRHLQSEGWAPPQQAVDPQSAYMSSLQSTMQELTMAVKSLKNESPLAMPVLPSPARAASGLGAGSKRSAGARAGGDMGVFFRQASLAALGEDTEALNVFSDSPARKQMCAGLAAQEGAGGVVAIDDSEDADLLPLSPARALVEKCREAAVAHPPAKTKNIPYADNTPLPEMLRQMAGPMPAGAAGVDPGDVVVFLDTQSQPVTEKALEVLPYVVRTLSGAQRPCTRLSQLLQTYGVTYASERKQHLAVSLLAVLSARRLLSLPCTP